jgi:hypothetical protein
MARLLTKALLAGLIGLVIGPMVGLVWVFGLMMFDPKCGAGDSGGCAMGLVTVPIVLALPSFALFALVSLIGGLWKLRPSDPAATIRKLRNWGRED